MLFISPFFNSFVIAQSITNVSFNGKTYYVDLAKEVQGSNTNFQIWFRTNQNASSVDDIKMAELSANTNDIAAYKTRVCRNKEIFDAGQTIIGCSSIIGSAFCAAATVATDGTLAFVCEATWNYTLSKGAADCFKGIADIVAKNLGKQNEWIALNLVVQLSEPDLAEAISKAIDMMCDDVKNNSVQN
jgi:hypothetical protein